MAKQTLKCEIDHKTGGIVEVSDWADKACWLSSLKKRNKSWQEWSVESKKKLNRIYRLLSQAADCHAFSTTCRLIGDKECIELQDFLMSLKPQTQWKPSEEQMQALAEALSLAKNCGEESAFDLRTLYEQLKKLSEE